MTNTNVNRRAVVSSFSGIEKKKRDENEPERRRDEETAANTPTLVLNTSFLLHTAIAPSRSVVFFGRSRRSQVGSGESGSERARVRVRQHAIVATPKRSHTLSALALEQISIRFQVDFFQLVTSPALRLRYERKSQ